MSRNFTLYLFILFTFVGLASCDKSEINVAAFQRVLNAEISEAMLKTEQVKNMLERESVDSLYMLVCADKKSITRNSENILFYIFDQTGLVFWSDNWLALNVDRPKSYDKWYYRKFENAHTICRLTTINNYLILTVIPIKYAYSFENQWLRNVFISPFGGETDVDIVPLLSDERLALYSSEGSYLFSLKKREKTASDSARVPQAVPSFSYQNLFGADVDVEHSKYRLWVKIMILVCVLFFAALCVWFTYLIIRHHGLRNLPLRYKILFWFSLLLLVSFLYVGLMVRHQIKERFEEGQRMMIRDKCEYIQAALKNKVAYMPAIGNRQAKDLSLELKELSLTYKTDIHVYDLAGNVVSTSFPEIFDSGLRSNRIAPQPMFERYAKYINSELVQTGEPLIQYERIGQMRYMAGYIECLNWDDIQIGYIGVPFYISENSMRMYLDEVMLKVMPAYIVALLMLIVVSIFISRALTYPIVELGTRLRNLDPTRKNDKLEYEGKDEVGELVESYNKMVDDLNRNVLTLTEKERESAWQTMARQVAHEINNPLTPMKLTVQQMQRAKSVGGERFDNYFEKATGMLIDQIDSLSRIAGSFSAFAKNLPDEINLDKVDVAAKLNNAVTMYANYDSLTVRYIGPEAGVFVYADVDQIGRVFTNILQNAVQAMATDTAEAKSRDNDIIVMLKQDSEWVEISISDNGPGIPEELRDKIFLPNFTTKTTGMGLGLAMCKNIVGRSGGELWYESKEGKGTTFFIKLRLV